MNSKKNNLKIEDGFKKYNTFLYKFAYSILKNEQDARDVTQETWIRVCHHINSYDPQKGASYKGWLGMICKRLCFDVIRKRKSHNYFGHLQFNELFAQHGVRANIEESAMYNETQKEIEKLLAKNPQHVELFRNLLDGHTARTLHLKTGMNESTIKSHMSNIRKKIQTHFSKDLERVMA